MLDFLTVFHSVHVPALLQLFPVAPVISCARSSPLPLLRAPAHALSEHFPAPPLPHGRSRCPLGALDIRHRAHALAADLPHTCQRPLFAEMPGAPKVRRAMVRAKVGR